MSLSEADNWLKGFTAWFDWNAPILNNKDPVTKRVLLENFLDERLLSKLRRNLLDRTTSQQHADTIRLKEFVRRQRYVPNKLCGGCGEDKIHHHRDDCPNINKRCYGCGKIGHVRDVCRSNPIIRKDERQEQMLVDLTRQLRDSIWRAESDQLN